jgi:O-antigen/teichoic acid export membrane protein
LLIALAAPPIVAVLAPSQYRAAAGPALWLTFAAVAQGAYYVAGLGITLARRTELLGWTAGGAAVVAIVGNVLLTPRWGPEGAAIASCAGYATSGVLAYVVSQRIHPLPYRGLRSLTLFAVALALAAAVERIGATGASGLAVRFTALLVFVLIAVRFQVWKDRGAVKEAPGV